MPARVYVGNLSGDVRTAELEDLFKNYRPDDIAVKTGFAFLIFDDPRDADDAIQDMDGARFGGRRIRVEPAGQRRGGGGGGGPPRGRSPPRHRSPPRYRSPPRRSPPRRRSRGRSYDRYGGGGSSRGRYRIVIEDIPHMTSWQDLKDFARDGGAARPIGAEVVTRDGDLVGILEFASQRDVDDAISRLDKAKIVPGRGARHHYPATSVRCYEDRERSQSRSYRRSRSRSRSRRRSRSRSRRHSRSRSPRRSRSRSRRRDDSRGRSRSRSPKKNSMARDGSPKDDRPHTNGASKDRKDNFDSAPPADSATNGASSKDHSDESKSGEIQETNGTDAARSPEPQTNGANKVESSEDKQEDASMEEA